MWFKRGTEEEWSGERLALMMGAPRATRVQLSPPSSAPDFSYVGSAQKKKSSVFVCALMNSWMALTKKKERKK